MCDKMKRNVQHRCVWAHTRVDRKRNYATSDKKVVTFHTEDVVLNEILVSTFKFFSLKSIWLAHDVGFDTLVLKMRNNPKVPASVTISHHCRLRFLSCQTTFSIWVVTSWIFLKNGPFLMVTYPDVMNTAPGDHVTGHLRHSVGNNNNNNNEEL